MLFSTYSEFDDSLFALYRNVTIWPLVQLSLMPKFPFFGPDVEPFVMPFCEPQRIAL